MKAILILALAFNAQAAEKKEPAAAAEIVSLDPEFPAKSLAAPGIRIRTFKIPVGENGPLPLPTVRKIQNDLALEFPPSWDALEQDLFFGRAEFQKPETVAGRYGSRFTPAQIARLGQALRAARAAAIRRGENQ